MHIRDRKIHADCSSEKDDAAAAERSAIVLAVGIGGLSAACTAWALHAGRHRGGRRGSEVTEARASRLLTVGAGAFTALGVVLTCWAVVWFPDGPSAINCDGPSASCDLARIELSVEGRRDLAPIAVAGLAALGIATALGHARRDRPRRPLAEGE
jgi:hypothetical protein